MKCPTCNRYFRRLHIIKDPLLANPTLSKHHPDQYAFFNDPSNIYLDFTKPPQCSLKHKQ